MRLRSAGVLILSQIGLKQAFWNQAQSVLFEHLILFPNRLLLQNWCLLWGYVSLIGHDDCWGNLSLWRENFNVSHKGVVASRMERQGIQEQEGVKHRDTCTAGTSDTETTNLHNNSTKEWMVGWIKL